MSDIFVSYQSKSTQQTMEVVEYLEKNNQKCWVAPRDVVVSYSGDIVEAISKCKIFLLILTKESCKSVHVLNELEQAYKYYKNGELSIIPYQIEECEFGPDMDYYISRIQRIDAYKKKDFEAMLELLNKIYKVLGFSPSKENLTSTRFVDAQSTRILYTDSKQLEQERISNRYYDVDDKYEKRRLITEAKMLLPYEKRVVDYLIQESTNLNMLVVSCMYAHGIMDKYDLSRFSNIIGLCYNEKSTFEANYDFKNDKCKFYTQDVEESNFEENLREYMEERGISGFDFIDITMGFLDWKNPFKVVRVLKKFMNKGCRIFVRDVDDSVLMAFPDDKNLFKKFFSFYPLDPIAGYRQSGKKVFSYFKKIGASEINLCAKGIDTSNMTYEQKEMLFHSFFGFIPNDFRIEYNKDTSKIEYKEIIDWCDYYYDDLEEEFLNEDFFYNSGYFLYAIKM